MPSKPLERRRVTLGAAAACGKSEGRVGVSMDGGSSRSGPGATGQLKCLH